MKKILFFLILSLLFVPRVEAATLQGWAKDVDSFTDVSILSCGGGSCSSPYTLTDNYFYDNNLGLVEYAYFTSPYHNLGTYGDMILNFHRYKAGYLYSHSKYVCFSTNVNINTVEVYTGSYTDTINKVGNLTYHNSLIQTLDNNPFSPGDEYWKCNLFVDLFVPKYDGQNIGTVIRGSTGGTQITLIGEKFEPLGLYTDTVKEAIQSIVSSSGLATSANINQVNNSINEVKQEVAELNNSVDDLNDTISDSDTSGASSSADDFFSGFETDTYGLTSVITAPLNLINQLTSSTCSPLGLEVPFLKNNKMINLPCMNEIYEDNFGSFYTIYKTVTFGLIAYWVCVRVFNLVKDFNNPDHDEIEVMDL